MIPVLSAVETEKECKGKSVIEKVYRLRLNLRTRRIAETKYTKSRTP